MARGGGEEDVVAGKKGGDYRGLLGTEGDWAEVFVQGRVVGGCGRGRRHLWGGVTFDVRGSVLAGSKARR